jgi:hypothetical protein
MSTSITRRGIALLAAGSISLFAALATASQAGAATYYACVKRNGSAHVFAKKPKCKRGESKISWNSQGPAGRNGLNGINGAPGSNGKNGTNGTNGAEGPAGPLLETLPSGRSEKGIWTVLDNGANGAVRGATIAFPLPLASPPTAHYIPVGGTPPAGCSGTAAAPAAAPGNLCVFETFNFSLPHLDFYAPESGTESATAAGKLGTVIVLTASAEGTQQATGTWAVTE